MVLAFVALGANLAGRFPSKRDALGAALGDIELQAGRVVARSRFYRSVAWPDPDDPEFVNAAAAVETVLSAAEFLARLHGIERDFGRVRRQVNAPRPLDLDILDFGGLVSAPDDTPVLPHPRMGDRAFVLLPLQDIAPHWHHPATGRHITELIAALPDRDLVKPL